MDRDTLLTALRSAICAETFIEAAWVSGSDATGRTDSHSDIDLMLLVPDPRAEDAFAVVERALDGLGGVAHTLVIPTSASGSYRQRFYRPISAPEHLMVDVCVLNRDHLAPFLDLARHGAPVVWLDREGLLSPRPDAAIGEIFAARRAQIAARTAMFAHIPEKCLVRGHRLEAFEMWNRMLLSPLVEMLRARLCPERQDFGLRYLDRDLPPDVYAQLEAIVLPDSDRTLSERIAQTRAWLEEEIVRSAPTG